MIKREFSDKIKVDILVKNIDGSDLRYHEDIEDVDKLVPEKYIKRDLDKLINE